MPDGDILVRIAADIAALGTGVTEAKEEIASIAEPVEQLNLSFREMAANIAASMREAGESVMELKEALSGIGEAVMAAFAVEAIASFIEKTIEAATSVERFAMTMHMPVEQAMAWQLAGKEWGVEVSSLETAHLRFAKAIDQANDPLSKQHDAFQRLGISMQTADGELKTQPQLWNELAAAVSKYKDDQSGAIDAILRDLTGRGAKELVPLLQNWQATIQDTQQYVESFGINFDQLTEHMHENEVTLAKLGEAWTVFKTEALDKLQPAFDAITSLLMEFSKAMAQGIDDTGKMGEAMSGATPKVSNFHDALQALIFVFNAIVVAVEAVIRIFGLLVEAFMACVNSIESAGNMLGSFIYDLFTGNFTKMKNDFKKNLDDIASYWTSLVNNIISTAQNMWNKVVSMAGAGAAAAKKAAEGGGVGGGMDKHDAAGSGNVPKQDVSQLKDYEQQLLQKQDVEGKYHHISLQEEIDFWKQKASVVNQAIAQEIAERGSAQSALLKDKEAIDAKLLAAEKQQYNQAQAAGRKAGKEELAEYKSDIQQKIEAAKGNLAEQVRIIDEAVAHMEQAGKTENNAYRALKLEQVRIHKQAEDEKTAITKGALETRIKILKLELQEQKTIDQTKVLTGDMTNREMVQSELAKVDQIYQLEMQLLQQEQALWTQGSQKWAEVQNKMTILTKQHELERQQIVHESVQKQIQDYQTFASKIGGLFSSTISGFLTQQQSWQKAMLGILNKIADEFASFIGKMVEKWILHELAKTASSETQSAIRKTISASEGDDLLGMIFKVLFQWIFGETAKTAAQTAGAATGVATAATEKMAYASTGASAAAASVAAIPFFGWAMAPEVFASTFALLSAPMDVGAWDVPANLMAPLHAGEMVVPKNFAEGLRSGGFGSNDNQSGGGNNMNVSINVNAIDTQSGMAFIKSQAGTIANTIKAQMRNGAKFA